MNNLESRFGKGRWFLPHPEDFTSLEPGVELRGYLFLAYILLFNGDYDATFSDFPESRKFENPLEAQLFVG